MFAFLYFYIALFFCSTYSGTQKPHEIFCELAKLLKKKENSLFKEKLDQAVKEGFDPSYEYSAPQGGNLENDYKDHTLLYMAMQIDNRNIARHLVKNYEVSRDLKSIKHLIYGKKVEVGKFVELGCISGNVKFLESLERLGIPFNFEKFNNTTLLHQAVLSGNLKAVEFLLDYLSQRGLEIDIDLQNCHGFTPLHVAISDNNPEIVEYLLSKGANVNKVDFIKDTPLSLIMQRIFNPSHSFGAKEKECINLLMAHGAALGNMGPVKINRVRQNILPSMIFLLPPHKVFYELVELLECTEPYLFKEALKAAIKKGFDPFCAYNCPNDENLETKYWGHNLLHVACTIKNKNIDLVRYLFDINPDCFDNLKISQDLEIIKCFIDNEIIDENKLKYYCVINFACAYGNIELLEYLKKKGFPLDSCSENGTTLLHIAASCRNLQMVEYFTNYYLSKKALEININKQDNKGNTPLHAAANEKAVEIIKYLLSKGADMRKENFNKKTPFYSMLLKCRFSSFSKEEKECIDLFIENGYTLYTCNRKLKNYLEARHKTLNAPKKHVATFEGEKTDVEERAKKKMRMSLLQ